MAATRARSLLVLAALTGSFGCINVVGLNGFDVEPAAGNPTDAGARPDADAEAGVPDRCSGGTCNVACSADAAARCPSNLVCAGGMCVAPANCRPEGGLACTPFGQCGCDRGKTCVADRVLGTGDGRCEAPGLGGAAVPCVANADCQIGLACYEGLCSSFCATAADCLFGTASICRPIGSANVCLRTCDPFAPVDECGNGAKCAYSSYSDVPVCMRAGTAADGASCGLDTQVCARGLTCTSSNTCRKLCQTGSLCATGTCPAPAPAEPYSVCP
jgi:hypothetical protein